MRLDGDPWKYSGNWGYCRCIKHLAINPSYFDIPPDELSTYDEHWLKTLAQVHEFDCPEGRRAWEEKAPGVAAN